MNENLYGLNINEINKISFASLILNLFIKFFVVAIFDIAIFLIIFGTLNISVPHHIIINLTLIFFIVFVFANIHSVTAILSLLVGVGSIIYYALQRIDEIRTGVLAICNQGYPVIRNSLGLPYADGFAEVEGLNCDNEIHLVMFVLFALLSLLSVVLIGKFLSVIYTSLVSILTLIFYYFIENWVCDNLIIVMLICLIILTILKATHLNKGRFINADVKLYLQVIFVLFVTVSVFISAISVVESKENYSNNTQESKIKNYVKYAIKDVMVLKYCQYKNYVIQDVTDVGQLSFFAYVKPTDRAMFGIETAPSNGKLFLRSYIGKDYSYLENRWLNYGDEHLEHPYDNTVELSKNDNDEYKTIEFRTGKEDGFSDNVYVPYYTNVNDCDAYNYVNDTNIIGTGKQKYSVNVYDELPETQDDADYYNYALENYMSVNEGNKAVIDEIISRAGLNKDDKDLDIKIKNYFKNNFKYTNEGDVVPVGNDFINYFAQSSKQGNFVHFASVATLIYRELGIPARYVGGYSLYEEQILAGKYSKKTDRFSLNVENANIYSWVEVYKKGFGWVPVDISPSPSFEEFSEQVVDSKNANNTQENSRDLIKDYFKPLENKIYNPLELGKNLIKVIAYVIVALLFILVAKKAAILIYRYLKWNHEYSLADNNKKAFMLMQRFYDHFGLKDFTNYSDIKAYFNNDKVDKLVYIANRSTYDVDVTDKDIEKLKKIITSIIKESKQDLIALKVTKTDKKTDR